MEPSNNIEATQLPIEDKPPQEAVEVKPVPPKPEKPKQTFKCLVCGKSYSKKTSLFTHHKTHPEHCVHCGENRGASIENIYEHNLKHINIRPFICKLCGDSFLRNQQFVEHEKSHDKPPEEPVIKESKYKCKTCQSSYSNWKLFYKHQQESGHFNEKFLCEICGSDFHSNFLLSQHIRRLHKRTDETFSCTSCSKVFATKPNLDSHIKKIHQNDSNKKHICEICKNSFSSAPNLKQHTKTVHEIEKEYECQTCKKPFKAKNRLTRHEKEVHMGNNGNPEEVRMYNCDHCQKKYKRSWHQARHSHMKHENSNASTATTSSAGTPPTPEINGNIPNNSNYNYQQLQQVPQMPSQPLAQEINPVTPTQQHQQQQIQQQNASIPPDTWNHMAHPQQPPQAVHGNHQHGNYATTNEAMDAKIFEPPLHTPGTVNNGEYVNYAVNEQYSNKFEQVQTTPAGAPTPTTHYESWNHQPAATSWDYNQQPQAPVHQPSADPSMYNYYYPSAASVGQQSEWYYPRDDPNLHHFNCLNQTPALYNGGNYYATNQMSHPITNDDFRYVATQQDPYANYHQNYQN